MKSMYEKIKVLRENLNMSQEELAIKLGYTSKTTISKIEAGKIDIPQSKIQKFADVLNTTTAYLMGWEEKSDKSTKETTIPKDCILIARKIGDVPEEKREQVINIIDSTIDNVLAMLDKEDS